jgi:hypothetical protein
MIGTVLFMPMPDEFQRFEREELRSVEIEHGYDLAITCAKGVLNKVHCDPCNELSDAYSKEIAKKMFADLTALKPPTLHGHDAVVLWCYVHERKVWQRALLHCGSLEEIARKEFQPQ